eukprot:gene6094-6711_t
MTLAILLLFQLFLCCRIDGFRIVGQFNGHRQQFLCMSSWQKPGSPSPQRQGHQHHPPRSPSNPSQAPKPQKNSAFDENNHLSKEYLESNWKTGYVFIERKQRHTMRRHDPWWMLDSELTNPRILPVHRPWWRERNEEVDGNWKVAELRLEAVRRGLSSHGLKKDLVERINESYQRYRLGDDNFTAAHFHEEEVHSGGEAGTRAAARKRCFPEHYEDGSLDSYNPPI